MTQETLLQSLATSDNQESDLTQETEFVPSEPLTHKEFKKYCGKLRLLGTIHAEIAQRVNEQRLAIFMPTWEAWEEVMENDFDFVSLWLEHGKVNAMEAETMPNLP